ncbi:uncharacterized protein LOC131158530 [Malania oleifera]|uniref:uncharacterized protein LOC131158530 n=1 Tax=Malania oleifera TaxID=397392 RepID=UPI0025ADE0A6|nr:uncharacterized protein LOC131158530 [Malania oleifera]
MVKALYGRQPEDMDNMSWKELEVKFVATIRLCLADDMMYHVMDEESLVTVWLKLESRYMSKSLTNKLYLKHKLCELKMLDGSDLNQHINVFNKIISDLKQRKKASDENSQGEELVVKDNQECGKSKFGSGLSNNKSRSNSKERKDISYEFASGVMKVHDVSGDSLEVEKAVSTLRSEEEVSRFEIPIDRQIVVLTPEVATEIDEAKEELEEVSSELKEPSS